MKIAITIGKRDERKVKDMAGLVALFAIAFSLINIVLMIIDIIINR